LARGHAFEPEKSLISHVWARFSLNWRCVAHIIRQSIKSRKGDSQTRIVPTFLNPRIPAGKAISTTWFPNVCA
jgi:hypothetical protein